MTTNPCEPRRHTKDRPAANGQDAQVQPCGTAETSRRIPCVEMPRLLVAYHFDCFEGLGDESRLREAVKAHLKSCSVCQEKLILLKVGIYMADDPEGAGPL